MCTDFDEYLKRHTKLRQGMLNLRYHNIHAVETKIKFFMKGIRGEDGYKQLTREWIASLPTRIRSLRSGAEIHAALELDYTMTPQLKFPQDTGHPTYVQNNIQNPPKVSSYNYAIGTRHNHDDSTCRDPRNSRGPNFQLSQPPSQATSKTTITKNRTPRRSSAKEVGAAFPTDNM